jgi:predicted short-subunit dehydrogenase-like oxidoreductase (DUF2520 family)
MRELDRIAVVGPGRLGTALTRLLDASGPYGRGADPSDATVVLLAVPDAEIARAAAAIGPGPLVGHCSGATTLEPLRPHEAFSLHPLLPVTADTTSLAGAGCAVAGSTERALAVATALAERLGMTPAHVDDADRVAYHAAASLASNYLTTLQDAAERLAASAGVERALLVPLVRAAVDNWARLGAAEALTGPIARGDEETVARQRAAVAERAPDLLGLWDALTDSTRELAAVAR